MSGHGLPFLLLDLWLLLPVLLIALIRPDLLRPMARLAACGLPFALAEPLFLGEYWDPPMLWGFGERWGVGVEDFLFVAALGALAVAVGPLATGAAWGPAGGEGNRARVRAGVICVVGCLLGGVLLHGLGLSAITAALAMMLAVPGVLLWRRPDLARPALVAGLVTAAAYLGACQALAAMMPDTFWRYWHGPATDRLPGGVPWPEAVYGFAAGFAAVVVHGVFWGERLVMPVAAGARWRNWIKASRLPSQAYIFFPLLLGQAWGLVATGRFRWPEALLTTLFGLFIQLYIVYANDYADADLDPLNTTFTPFSGGSRVLVEGGLSRAALGGAAILMAAACLAVTAVLAARGVAAALPLGAVSLILLWLYSFPPVRLSYRGGGEFLQMLGVGIVLPLLGFAAQAGSLGGFPWRALVPLLPLQLGCAFSTTLPDMPSDRLGGKRTISVLGGLRAAKAAVILLELAAVALYGMFAGGGSGPVIAVPLLALAGMGALARRAIPGTPAMTGFVTGSILTTVALVAGMAVAAFRAATAAG